VQLHELRYLTVRTRAAAPENFARVEHLAQSLGWRVTRAEAGRTLEFRTPDSLLQQGELVAVSFRARDVLVASITDPAVGFSLVGRSRCRQNRELIKGAVLGSPSCEISCET